MTDFDAHAHAPSGGVALSVIVSAHNEEGNIQPLLDEIDSALTPTGMVFEVIGIDDGSTDRTAEEFGEGMERHRWLRVFRHTNAPPGRGVGLSAGFATGIRHSRGELIAFLDADLQNDPADLPGMVDLLRERGVDMVQGDRTADRRDNFIRRISSWVARSFHLLVLGDRTRDTGCSLRVVTRPVAAALPLHLRGMHRFIPFYVEMLGHRVLHAPVHHRPRGAGRTKFGILNRAVPGVSDILAVRWMARRYCAIEAESLRPTSKNSPTPQARP